MTTPHQVYTAVFAFLKEHGTAPLAYSASPLTAAPASLPFVTARPEPTLAISPGIGDNDRRRRRAVGDRDDSPQIVRPAWLVFSMPPPAPPPDLPPSPIPPPPPIITPPTHIPTPGGGGGPGGIAALGEFETLPPTPFATDRLLQPVIVAPVDRTSFEDYFTNGAIESFWRLPTGNAVVENESGATMATGSRMMIDKVVFTNCQASMRLGSIEPESADTVLVRANLSGSVNGYGLRQNEAAGNAQIIRFDAGVETILATYIGAFIGPGDTLRLDAIGTTLSAYKNGGLLGSVVDATYATGSVGVYTPGLVASPLTYFAVVPA